MRRTSRRSPRRALLPSHAGQQQQPRQTPQHSTRPPATQRDQHLQQPARPATHHSPRVQTNRDSPRRSHGSAAHTRPPPSTPTELGGIQQLKREPHLQQQVRARPGHALRPSHADQPRQPPPDASALDPITTRPALTRTSCSTLASGRPCTASLACDHSRQSADPVQALTRTALCLHRIELGALPTDGRCPAGQVQGEVGAERVQGRAGAGKPGLSADLQHSPTATPGAKSSVSSGGGRGVEGLVSAADPGLAACVVEVRAWLLLAPGC